MKQKLTLAAAIVILSAGLSFAQGNPGAHMLEQWDGDADGILTLDEAKAKRNEIFFMFDIGGDGSLTVEDWAGIAEHLDAEMGDKGNGHGQGKGPGAVIHAAMTPAFNDADGDGSVTVAEFDAGTDKLFAALDRNGDKVVTLDDFGG